MSAALQISISDDGLTLNLFPSAGKDSIPLTRDRADRAISLLTLWRDHGREGLTPYLRSVSVPSDQIGTDSPAPWDGKLATLLKFLLLRNAVNSCPGLTAAVLPPDEKALWSESDPLGNFWPLSVMEALDALGDPVSETVRDALNGKLCAPEGDLTGLARFVAPGRVESETSAFKDAGDKPLNVRSGESVIFNEGSDEDSGDRPVIEPLNDGGTQGGNVDGTEGHESAYLIEPPVSTSDTLVRGPSLASSPTPKEAPQQGGDQ